MLKILSTAIVPCAAVASIAFATVTHAADTYPTRVIRIVVGYGAGGNIDQAARLLAQKLSENLGQPVIVENRAGAGGSLADERVARSPADGYTLLMITSASTVVPALRKLSYDLERDLAPVTLVGTSPNVFLVHPSVPARTIKELIALARAQPGKLSYGSAGIGSSMHLSGELFNLMAKANIVHVPFKGAPESATAATGGHIEMVITSLSTSLPFVNAGKLRALAVSAGKRSALLPAIPTVEASGLPGYVRFNWYGMLAPSGVQKDVISRLNSIVEKEVSSGPIRQILEKQGMEPQTSTPEQLAALINREIAENAKLVKLAGIKPE